MPKTSLRYVYVHSLRCSPKIERRCKRLVNTVCYHMYTVNKATKQQQKQHGKQIILVRFEYLGIKYWKKTRMYIRNSIVHGEITLRQRNGTVQRI